MANIIDRRLNGKNKSAVNRERFLRRFKGQIKDAVAKAIKGRSITDIESGETISIPVKDISEPAFRHGKGGVWEPVHPGNQEFVKGDRLPRPQGGGGGGSGSGKASQDGEGEDAFAFELSREEFMNVFFDDLALPNLVKTELTGITEMKTVRAGFTNDGTPANINIVRSLRGALSRRIAMAAPTLTELDESEEALDELMESGMEADLDMRERRRRIHILREKLAAIPFIDPFDLRYNNRVKQPTPSSQAVMFCLMDVSGSMDEQKKDMAKRFFILLYLFLQRTYDKIELVFIRHHTSAVEVNEHDFFHSRESGGTVVSSALNLMKEVVQKRYAGREWNIYAAQASDGDNWDSDSANCARILETALIPVCQYYAYIEITEGEPQNLWYEYLKVKDAHKHFAMQKIRSAADIYPVFRELFKKQQGVSK
ncbi:YeaH/YhbH family protein [Craterilacuibacter sp. RT1T]|uniref:YeaH/YhbH family protein n=1 Tax=Craterilacuibacter sp. RT1T TaxID=2942211 RepID=UPI0020BEB10D|nr:YeaH/YhbH family protein [Craterilacuibacter sp. RT1T]MCL6262509.1 YeaH/YhbH family protein [Craterilacuibacter sp. RT1T]